MDLHAVDYTEARRRTLLAVATALLPAVEGQTEFERSSIDQLGLDARLAELVASFHDPRTARDVGRLLSALGSAPGGLIMYGSLKPFHALSPEDAEKALRTMATSRNPIARQGFVALKKIVSAAALTTGDDRRFPVAWEAMGYPGPSPAPTEQPGAITPLAITADTTLTCDVVVVGSGAGGGVAAGVLAAAGLDVVVLEKGGYATAQDLSQYESEAYRDLYLGGIQGNTKDLGVAMLAGATLGGGTVINYTTSFATPESVRSEWDDVAGFTAVFTGDEYESSSQAVHERLGVNTEHNEPSLRDATMEQGLADLGWHVDAMPRNVQGCDPGQCGFCTMGCRIGAKQSTLVTWLQDAFDSGARIVVGADCKKVTTSGDSASGVEAEVDGIHQLTVKARAVVLAAGSLNTPAILLRSGLGGPAAGRNLRLHPAIPVWGAMTAEQDPWTGVMQARYSDQFVDLDGKGYGVKFETAPIHPLFVGVLTSWDSGAQFKRAIMRYRTTGVVGVLLRDTSAGRVAIDRKGRGVWSYRLNDTDTGHFREGIKRAAEVLAAAGAREVSAPTAANVVWNPAGSEDVEAFMRRMDGNGYGATRLLAASWHQMGSARMGSSPKTSVVGAENESHDTKALYVLDASTFPTASGVNPMITIEAIAHRGARALAAALHA